MAERNDGSNSNCNIQHRRHIASIAGLIRWHRSDDECWRWAEREQEESQEQQQQEEQEEQQQQQQRGVAA